MFAEIMKCVVLGSLLAVVFWGTAANYQLLLNLIVSGSLVIRTPPVLSAPSINGVDGGRESL